MRTAILIITVLLVTGCSSALFAPKRFSNHFDKQSKELRKESNRCRSSSFYAVSLDTTYPASIHLVMCVDRNFNVSVFPLIKKGVAVENAHFYSGTYETFDDTMHLNFNKGSYPKDLSKRILQSADKKSLFWFFEDSNNSLVLQIKAWKQ